MTATIEPGANASDPTSPSPYPSLVILRATTSEQAGATLRVAGLTIVERALKQLARVKGLRVVVITDGSIPLPTVLPPRVQLQTLPSTPRTVASPTQSAEFDAAVASASVALGALVPPSPGAASAPPPVVHADVVRRAGEPLTAGIRVVDETTRRRAEDAIFADLLRGDLGFIARHINKKISFRITRHILCKLPVTPNQVTLAAAAVGLLGCLLIASGTYATTVAGFLAVQAQSVLDGCDGELARVRFQQSALGEWLDTLVDDFLNFSLVGSIGLGLWRSGHGIAAAGAAAAACAMLLVYNAVSYRELLRQGVGGELLKLRWKITRGVELKSLMSDASAGGGGLSRALLSLGRRDVFIFSWMIAAILDIVPFALFWALVIALSCFVTAVGQLTLRDSDASAVPPG